MCYLPFLMIQERNSRRYDYGCHFHDLSLIDAVVLGVIDGLAVQWICTERHGYRVYS